MQRVLLAFALEPKPDLLLLDEPVSAVDRKGIALFYDLVTSMRAEHQMPVLLVSHDPVSYTHLDVYKRQTWSFWQKASRPSAA